MKIIKKGLIYRAVDGKYNDLKICMRNIEKAKNDPQMKEVFEKSDLAMTFVYLYLFRMRHRCCRFHPYLNL